METRPYTIGFSNLTEKLSFSVDVRRSLEAAAANYPNVNLIVRDNNQDTDQAKAHAEEFAELPVDVALIYHIDERGGLDVVKILQQKRIPIISIEIAIPLTISFSIDNEAAGTQSGEALGNWIQAHWDGQVDKVLVLGDYRLTGMIRRRLDFAVKAMAEVLGKETDVFTIHSGNIRETAAQNVTPVMNNWGRDLRIAIIGQNDDTTLGAIDAARELGMAENVVGVGYGATELALKALQTPGSRLIASVDMYPEKYGEPLLDLALRMIQGEKVPRVNTIHPGVITAESFG